VSANPQIQQRSQEFLLTLAFALAFCFSIWQVLLNNFVVEVADFGGVEIGILQSLREVPGFLAFGVVFVLVFCREQKLILYSLALMSVGIAATGFFPFSLGLYVTTVLMSIGFHYFETLNQSLTLQWVDKTETPRFMGRGLAVRAVASLSAYAIIWLAMGHFQLDYRWMYLLAGVLGIAFVAFAANKFQTFPQHSEQHNRIILRSQYWLYYALVFFGGARRQIFVVFAGFMMVEKFGYSVADISLLFIINYVFNLLFAARIGRWIGHIGERRALIIEYTGLIAVFIGYAFVSQPEIAAVLYIIDHLFFALAIAMNTYFQKISAPQDIAATASLSFTINHIAAVFMPLVLGLIWVISPGAVFLVGAALATISLLLSFNIPRNPAPGNEMILGRPRIAVGSTPASSVVEN